jgi:Dolichyl-phosphate-mannose-protein mannosyltransferase
VRRHLPAVLGIFGIALAIRVWLLQGLILGDDAQEFGVLQHVLANGPDLRDQLQVRFGGWVLNYVICGLLGVSETTVILPSMLLSSALAALAYVLLVHWRYERWRAALGALLVATAPFEVMLGTCRTNDLVLGGTLAFGFAALVLLESRPLLQGVLVALALWFGFYVKLWAVYVLPGLGLYALVGRRWRAAASFVVTSAVVHGATIAYWKVRLGSYTPFIDVHAANFAVPAKDLLLEWSRYVHMIFVGSEFGTTLWGVVPWLLVLLMVVRTAMGRLDRADGLLLGYWGLFFLLIEFFPNGFTFDRYYSVPRIFRYLAPLSFPIALHAAKLTLDATRSWRPAWTALAVVVVLSANLLGSIDATEPGRVYRDSLHRVVRAIEQ